MLGSKALESAWRKVLSSREVTLFFKAENLTPPLWASTNVVNCSTRMRWSGHMVSRLLSLCSYWFGFGAKTFSRLFFREMPFHDLHSFQPARAISLHCYSVPQRSRESRHELPIVMKALFCTQETNLFSCIVYCPEPRVLRPLLLQTYRGQSGKLFGAW